MPGTQLQLIPGQLDSMAEDLRYHIAVQIPIFMKAKGIENVEELAKLTTIHRSTLYKILAEANDSNRRSLPSLRSLLGVACVLGIGINSLIT